MRKLAIAAAVSLLAACSGGSSTPSTPSGSGCTLTFSGGASETLACDAVVRANGSGGYVLSVTATRGGGMSVEQAAMLSLVVSTRPVAHVEYGWTSPTVPTEIGSSSHAERWAADALTHEANAFDPSGALHVHFTEIPATDPADPTGLDGIGTVHGTVSGTLVSVPAGGAAVTLSGSF